MSHPHRFFLFLVCSVLGACATPEPGCETQQVQATLSAMVREQFLWAIMGDPMVPVEADRREQFTSAVTITVADARPVEPGQGPGTLHCSARILFVAPPLSGGLTKKADSELAYRVIRGKEGGFLVEVAFPDVKELSKRVGKQFSLMVL